MTLFKVALSLCVAMVCVQGDVAPGQNQYLPPQKGYSYDKPSVTFSTPTRPTQRPTQRPYPPPTSGYTPPPRPPKPSYGPPSYTPSQPTFAPPTQPPYRPPSLTPPRPGYLPPTGATPSRPPGPTYGTPTVPPYRPSPTQPPYRPPTPTRPTYIPPATPTRPPYRPTSPGQPPYEGQPSGNHGAHEHHEHHHHEPGMPFDFTYAVNDIEHGNDYSHNAVSDGDVTRGEYRVQMPDGRLQIVKYTADWKNGFNAQVSYEGQPTYPNYQGSPSGQQPAGGYKY